MPRIVSVAICVAAAVACSGKSTSGGAGSGGSSDAVCVYYCATTSDCCTDCTYPNDYECIGHRCVYQGCATDADCAGCTSPSCPGSGHGRTCRPVGGTRRCLTLCTTMADCAQQPGPVNQCSATDDVGDRYCTWGGYGDDPPLPGCTSDADCDGAHGFGYGVCNAKGLCVCSADSQCPQHWVCGSP